MVQQFIMAEGSERVGVGDDGARGKKMAKLSYGRAAAIRKRCRSGPKLGALSDTPSIYFDVSANRRRTTVPGSLEEVED